jgi:cell wall-associated NlpC family hydrolase
MPTLRTHGRVVFGGAIALLCAIAPLFLEACGPAAPRFRSGASTRTSGDGENELRFATRIRAEEEREDDRQVDIEKVRNHLAPGNRPSHQYSNQTPAGLDRDRLLLGVISYLGAPYEYGGNTKEGIDCSGFTLKVYESGAATMLPRSARDQFAAGSAVAMSNLEFGDLVFFNTTGQRPSHVGIYIEDDVFAHASVSKGVTFSSLESTYYRKRFVGARRIVTAKGH